MAKWKKVPAALAERFEQCLPRSGAVERRKMFGCPCAFVNGNMFAGLHEDRLIVRVPVEAAAHPFVVMGRTMREYAALENALEREPAELKAWIARAFAHTRALPPKPAPKPKARARRR